MLMQSMLPSCCSWAAIHRKDREGPNPQGRGIHRARHPWGYWGYYSYTYSYT